ncbi:MAG TPA: DegV family protein [Solimonas sp.]|nr:DegV family protein [Solimonas sp.]
MRIGIAIDVSTDVSQEFVEQHQIHVLPSAIHMGDEVVVYDRDLARGLAFYRDHLADKGIHAETTPFSVKEIEDLFLRRLVLEYDYVFLITLSSTRSLTFENAHKASFTILQSYHRIRSQGSVPGPFALRVVDSQTLFTGPGVLAWETVRMVSQQRSPTEIRKRLDELVPQLYAYLVPDDLYYMRARAAKRGDQSVSLMAYLLGNALDIKPIIQANRLETRPVARVRHFAAAVERLFRHGAERIASGTLKVPMIGVSYGGDPAEVRLLPGFEVLEQAATAHGVELMVSMMAPAAAVNVGGGALTLAYCGEPGEFANPEPEP